MQKLTDESILSWGKYKGIKLINVPASYLIWCYENNKCSKDVKEYIEDNLDVLNKEIKQTNIC